MAELQVIIEQERKQIVTSTRPSVLRAPNGGLTSPDAREQILDIDPYKVREEFKERAPVTSLILECLLKKTIQSHYPGTEKEYELLTDRRIGFLAGMIGKMANRKLSLMAAQTSLALNASGLSLEAINGLEFYGLTVSSETARKIHNNECSRYDEIPRAVKAAHNSDGKVLLNQLQKMSHVYLGENMFPEKFVKNRAGGVSITHDYISGDLKNGHSNTEHDSTMEVKLDYSIDNLDRNVEVKHVGHCTDQEIHVVTVVGKAEEVRDRDLSDTEPLIQAVNLNAPQVLPDAAKVEKILNQFAVLMTRSLVERIPCLKRFKDWTEWHMPHEYADIKSQGTVLFCLGALDHHQISTSESAQILTKLSKIIPRNPITNQMMETCITGDELTESKFISAQKSRKNEILDDTHRFHFGYGGFHTMNTFMKRIMKEFESSETKYVKGTYTASCYTANNKKAATKSPKNKHNKVLDMLLLVMEVSTVAVFETVWGILGKKYEESSGDHFDATLYGDLNDDELMKNRFSTKDEFLTFIIGASRNVLKYVLNLDAKDWAEKPLACLTCHKEFKTPNTLSRHIKRMHETSVPSVTQREPADDLDGRFNYNASLLFTTLLLANYNDSLQEGDGDREELCLRFIYMYFRKTGSTRYTHVCLRRLVDSKVKLSAQQEHALRHNSTSAMRAGKGQRMPNDQIHEIFNGMISSQVKKKSYEGIHKAGCALGLTIKCKKTLMRNAKGLRKKRKKHPERRGIFRTLVNTLKEEEVFVKKLGRKGYPGFESIRQNFLYDQKRTEDIFMYTQKYCDALKTKPAVGLSGKVPDHDDSDLEKSDDESDDESSDSSKSSSSEMDDN